MLAIEAKDSLELYRTRMRKANGHRRLHHHHHMRTADNSRPRVKDRTEHGMMIDAGSQGTRIHVYEFEPRILSHVKEMKEAVAGRKLSIPTTDTRWTNRLKPGLDSFAFVDDQDKMVTKVAAYLEPLIEFAETVLVHKKAHWGQYPIYLKATGGLRTLPRPYRIRLINAVRTLMQNKTFNPFYFEDENARVISGEEEAIYGWTAVNFVKGTLIQNSEGSGTVLRANLTYGVLEMGGASTQIGFFEPAGDVMANLFKLQIGASKHWNVYVHSFLYFGVNGAYDRLNARLYMYAASAGTNGTDIYNPCLPGGSEYLFTSRVHMDSNGTLLPLSSPYNASLLEATKYSARMRNTNSRGNFDECAALATKILRKEANGWCDFSHDRDCSFAGIYQPPLPINQEDFGEFIATSNFFDVWDFLRLQPRSSLLEVKDGARRICSFSLKELTLYNDQFTSPTSDSDELTAMCFRATLVATLLIDGFGFPETYHVTAADVVNGQKVGWALGSMLYEINTLPWVFNKKYLHKLHSMDILAGDSFEEFSNSELAVGTLLLLVLLVGLIGSSKLVVSRLLAREVVFAAGSETVAFTRPQTDYGARGWVTDQQVATPRPESDGVKLQ